MAQQIMKCLQSSKMKYLLGQRVQCSIKMKALMTGREWNRLAR
ncbi:hypothetical protein ACHAXN_000157 [Cyclotella atomus]